MNPERTPVAATQEKYFLNTFPLIHLILMHKLSAFCLDQVDDIKQKVALSLWKWLLRRPDKELTEEEWLKLSNTSTHNEIKHLWTTQMSQTISLSEISESQPSKNLPSTLQVPPPTGNTKTETASLIKEYWKIIKKQTLMEKSSLLLENRKILVYLFSHRCCGIKEVAESLEITTDEFKKLYKSLPLSNDKIGLWLAPKLNKEIKADQISKARQRMRAKLKSFQKT